MKLRGYDEYEVTLGDEMRGERASLGRTLEDAQSDLRIRAHIIRAIEDCDLDGFPNDSVVAGYVRSYARYLGLDPEACYSRFCTESGFRSPVSALGGFDQPAQSGGLQNIVAAGAVLGTGLSQSRFAVRSGPVPMSARFSLGGITSVFAMLALIVGLGYGGYGLLQDIQRVRVAPLPEAPEVVVEAPMINAPLIEGGLLRRPDADAYQGDGVLAAAAPADLPPPTLPTRDGPISAIDPATSGVFRNRSPFTSADVANAGGGISAEDAALLASRTDAFMAGANPAGANPAGANPTGAAPVDAVPVVAAAVPSGPPTVVIHATDAAWIRINDGDSAVVYEGILTAGSQFEVPDRVANPLLRTGNAGAVYLLVGSATYGPVGRSGGVISNLSLRAADVENRIPQASAEAIGAAQGGEALQRAEAVVSQ
jgi:cytoskeletal protein RodZ